MLTYASENVVLGVAEWSDPMNGTAEVCLTLTEGPICGLGDARIEASYPLSEYHHRGREFSTGRRCLGS